MSKIGKLTGAEKKECYDYANKVGGECYRGYCQKNHLRATREGEAAFKAGMVTAMAAIMAASKEVR